MDDDAKLINASEQEAEGQPKKARFDLAAELFDWVRYIVVSFVAIMLVFTFAASVYSIEQGSMTNTLDPGNRVLVSRLSYTPRRGDIVLFVKHGYSDTPLIKRVIGLPGDVIDYDSGTLYLNGEALDEPYIREPMTHWTRSEQPTEYPATVPDGCVFVIGDNRNDSKDSRMAEIGFVDQRSILGHVLLRVAPLTKFGPVT